MASVVIGSIGIPHIGIIVRGFGNRYDLCFSIQVVKLVSASDGNSAARPEETILIALGGNLPSAVGPPEKTLEAALSLFPGEGIALVSKSSWYRSTPVPQSDQPLFVNGVARVACALSPHDLLAALLKIERAFGRERGVANAARTLDLDILAFGARMVRDDALTLPHPRMADRLFVLLPLVEMLPEWRHPTSGRRARDLLSDLRSLGGRDRVETL